MVLKRRARRPGYQERIARERVRNLFNLARNVFKERPELAHRYAGLARRIAMRYNIRLPKTLKRHICKKCHRYLMPGSNCQVRARRDQGAVIIKCLECGHVMRFPYRKGVKKPKSRG